MLQLFLTVVLAVAAMEGEVEPGFPLVLAFFASGQEPPRWPSGALVPGNF